MPGLPEKCFACPHLEGCPEFQEAFDQFYDEVQREVEEVTGRTSFVIYSCYIPIFDDNDPACRGIYLHLSDAPPDDHLSPSAQQ
jgi:hypothetical protein